MKNWLLLLLWPLALAAQPMTMNSPMRRTLPSPPLVTTTSGTTFYVDPGGNNANTGRSLGQAWLTTSYALTNAATTNSWFTNATTVLWTGGDVFTDTNAVGYFDAIKYPVLLCGSGSSKAVLSNYFMQQPAAGNGWTVKLYEPSLVTISNLDFTGQQPWLVTQQSSNSGFEALQVCVTNGAHCSNDLVTDCLFNYGYNGFHCYTASNNGAANGWLSNVTVLSCVFNSNINTGFETESFDDDLNQNNLNAGGYVYAITVSNCVFSNIVGDAEFGAGGFGVFFLNASNAFATGCIVHDGGENAKFQTGGGSAGLIAARSFNVTFSSNEVYAYHWNGSTDGDGIDFDLNCFGCTAEYNYVHGCDGAGFYSYDAYGDNVWRFNVCVSNASKNFAEFTVNNNANTPTNYQIYNNNFIGLVRDPVQILCAMGGSNIFVNNIFFTTNLDYVVYTLDTTHVTFQTNDYWSGQAAGACAFYWNGTVYATVAAWHTGTGQDKATPFNADPKWVNGYAVPTLMPSQFSSTTDWTLLSASSPLLNQATGPYAFPNGGIDWLGNALGATFNVGAVNASQ